ncbi:MAG: cupin domain-containing protein [Candidatus Latescibacterota bacterium]
MKRIMAVSFIAVFFAVAASAQDPYPYRALDPRQFDPAVDPDIDMFVNHWSNSVPRLMYGSLVFRDVLTGLEGKDSLHPSKKGAVLLEQTAISYATIEPDAIAAGSAKKGGQQIFYVTGGTGKITSGGKSYALKEGMAFILTPEFDFEILGTGKGHLSFYVVTEPLPENFKANKNLVVKNRFDGNKNTGAHWAHIGNGIIGSGDGVANYSGLSLITIDSRTIPHPHSHGTGIEECWIMVKGDTMLLLGKQLRHCPAGTIYKIPPTGLTAHTNINLGDEPIQMIHMMKSVPGETKEFAMLDPNMYDPSTEPDIDMFIGNWRNSTPRIMHGNFIFRDMLTALEGTDDLHPARRGACLTYAKAISYATLEPGATARTAKGELNGCQQTFIVNSGTGVLTSGDKTVELKKGMAFILTPGLDFTLTATGDKNMTFYVATEIIPAGFSPNKTLEVVDNRGEAPFMKVHWANIDRVMVGQKNGMCQYSAFTEVKLDAMTIAQPHSHEKGVEEIWIATDGDIELLLGKQLRKLPVGTAYRIPSTGKTAHANINASDDMVKLIHMMKVPQK